MLVLPDVAVLVSVRLGGGTSGDGRRKGEIDD